MPSDVPSHAAFTAVTPLPFLSLSLPRRYAYIPPGETFGSKIRNFAGAFLYLFTPESGERARLFPVNQAIGTGADAAMAENNFSGEDEGIRAPRSASVARGGPVFTFREEEEEGLGPVAPRIQKSRNFDLVCEPVSPDGLDGFVDIGFTDKCELPASAASARPRSDSELSEAFGFQPNETRWL